MFSHSDIERPEPRWPAILAVFASATLQATLPGSMRIGPPWLIAGTVVALVAVAWTTRRVGLRALNDWLSLGIVGVLTVGLGYGLATLLAPPPSSG